MRPRRSRHPCNPKCYNAISRDCTCACGGVNHGVGELKARQNCRELGIAWSSHPQRVFSPKRRRRSTQAPEQGWLSFEPEAERHTTPTSMPTDGIQNSFVF
jgi:hypothetical protein